MSKYPMVGCSQCGARFAGGDEGYSLCRNHQHRHGLTDREIDAMTAHAAAIKVDNDAYTQGQLRAGLPTVDGVAFRNRLHTADGRLIALVFGCGTDDGEANTTRLAACWNACAGVPTETLELAASWGDIVTATVNGSVEPDSRPQNCGTGYCSCIECPYPATAPACIDTPEQGDTQ